jgi:molybdate transport system substrate-binding protein
VQRRSFFLGTLGLVLASLQACGPGDRKDVIYVYAASSLQDAIKGVNQEFQRETGIKVILNTGSSGKLSMQIEAGGRCDVFLSAGEQEMDRLAALDLVRVETRKTLLSNQLVVIVAKGEGVQVSAPADLAGDAITRLSIANPESVPAGRYAKAWLESAGLWDRVSARILPGIDVRAALSQVEFGAAEAGIVYRTDAAISDKVEIAYAVPLEEGPKVTYPAAAMVDRPRSEQSQRYLDFLRGAAAREIFTKNGFLVQGS